MVAFFCPPIFRSPTGGPPYQPPALVGAPATSTTGNTSSMSASLPSGIVAGERLFLFVAGQAGAARTVSPPAGWTALYNDAAVSGNLRFAACFTKIADGSEGASVTVNFSAGVNVAAIAVRVEGSVANCEVGAANVQTAADIGYASFTPSANGRLWLLALHKLSVVAAAQPGTTNFTASVAQSTNVSMNLADKTEDAPTQWFGAWTSSAHAGETRPIAIW